MRSFCAYKGDYEKNTSENPHIDDYAEHRILGGAGRLYRRSIVRRPWRVQRHYVRKRRSRQSRLRKGDLHRHFQYEQRFRSHGERVEKRRIRLENIRAEGRGRQSYSSRQKGYTFRYWSADGVNEFNFATDTIKKNTTITAIYTNNVYRHTPVIDARLEYIRQADGSYAYEIVEGGYDGASLSAVELNPETTTIKSTYEGSLTELACPTARDGDKFRFWFYMQDGKPVQFTKWATEGASSVAMLAKYYFTKGLTLYAMYDSTLPRMEVEYCDSLSETIYKSGDSYPSNAQISQSDAYVATKTGIQI